MGISLLQVNGINDSNKKYNLEFHITSGNDDNIFDMSLDGALMLIKKLDRETQDSYTLRLTAVEQGKSLSYYKNKTSVTIFVTVADANDNAPKFSTDYFELSVSEDEKIGYTLTQLAATDADLQGTPNADIIYNIISGDDDNSFHISAKTGLLTVNKTLDYDTGNIEYKLVIIACDQGVPSLCNLVNVKVSLLDENDNTPTFPVNEYFQTIPENERIGTSVFTARATDLDRGPFGKLNYSITSSNFKDDSWRMFQIDPTTGLINTNVVFDYEQRNKYVFSVKASDNGGKSSTVKVRIDIESRDEFYPQFTQKTYNFGVPLPKSGFLPSGYLVGYVSATDKDKGIDGRIVYQLSTSHSLFKINRSSGAIVLKRKEDVTSAFFGPDNSISLVVTASSGRQGSLTNKTAVEISIDLLAVVSDNSLLDGSSMTSTGGLSDWALGLLIAFIFIIIIFAAAFLFLHMKNKRHKNVNKPGLNSEGVGATNSYVDPSAFDTIPIRGGINTQYAPPKYDEIPPYGPHTVSSNSAGAATASELSGSEQSGSSGRGSAEEGDDGEDEEIRMINEGPRDPPAADDNLSDVSVHNTQQYLAKLGIVAPPEKEPAPRVAGFTDDVNNESDIATMIYAKLNEVGGDDTAAALERAIAMGAFSSPPGERPASTQRPAMTGSLSSIVHSEEELTGSYNWDYLLNWGPQYQPLAHVFSEIARLKDDAVSLQSGASNSKVRPVPRPPQHLPRSPISHDMPGTFSAAAMSPSFSPSLSPLANRSPSISPLVGPGLPPGPNGRKSTHSTLRL